MNNKPSVAQQLASIFNPAPEDLPVAIDEAPFGDEAILPSVALELGSEAVDTSTLYSSNKDVQNKSPNVDQPLSLKGDIFLGENYRGIKRTREELGIEEGYSVGIGDVPPSLSSDFSSSIDSDSESIEKEEEREEEEDSGNDKNIEELLDFLSEQSSSEEEFEEESLGDENKSLEDEFDEIERSTVNAFKSQQIEELKKAKDTRNQKFLLERMMDFRILLNRIQTLSNKLPKPDVFPLFLGKDIEDDLPSRLPKKQKRTLMEVCEKKDEVVTGVNSLITSMLDIRQTLITKNPDIFSLEEESTLPVILEDKAVSYKQYAKSEALLMPKLDDLVSTWNKKTQVASGKTFLQQNKFKSINVGTLTQIQRLLEDKERLVKRTQLRRDNGRVIGASLSKQHSEQPVQDTDEEIFDDSDFYNLMLQKAYHIESNDMVEAGQNWAKLKTLQKQQRKQYLRGNEKKNFINYEVRPKLVNFMPPRSLEPPLFTEELFEGLLGAKSRS